MVLGDHPIKLLERIRSVCCYLQLLFLNSLGRILPACTLPLVLPRRSPYAPLKGLVFLIIFINITFFTTYLEISSLCLHGCTITEEWMSV